MATEPGIKSLPPQQRDILIAIYQETKAHGYPPSITELKDLVGIRSTSTVHSLLERLEDLGYVTRRPGKQRSIQLVDPEQLGLGPEVRDRAAPCAHATSTGSSRHVEGGQLALMMICPGCHAQWNTRQPMPTGFGWGVPVPFEGEMPLHLGCGRFLRFIGPCGVDGPHVFGGKSAKAAGEKP